MKDRSCAPPEQTVGAASAASPCFATSHACRRERTRGKPSRMLPGRKTARRRKLQSSTQVSGCAAVGGGVAFDLRSRAPPPEGSWRRRDRRGGKPAVSSHLAQRGPVSAGGPGGEEQVSRGAGYRGRLGGCDPCHRPVGAGRAGGSGSLRSEAADLRARRRPPEVLDIYGLQILVPREQPPPEGGHVRLLRPPPEAARPRATRGGG